MLTYKPFTATSTWLPVKWRYFWVTSDHVRSHDVISCHVSATCELQPCGSSNVPKTWLIVPLKPLRWLQVKRRHFRVTSSLVRSHDVISYHVTATSCELQPCGAQNVPKTWHALYSHFRVTSGQTSSLPGHFRSREVTWRHFLLRDCHLLRFTALRELKCTQNLTYRPFTATSGWLQVKWHHFRITFGNVRSRDVISCHIKATSCELQPCWS